MGEDETVFAVVARYQYDADDPAVYDGGEAPDMPRYAVVWAEATEPTEGAILAAARQARQVFGRVHSATAEQWQMLDLYRKWGEALGCCAVLEHASAEHQAEAFNTLWQLVNEGRFSYSAGLGRLHQQLAGFTIDQTGRLPRFTGGSGGAVDDWVYAVCWARVAAGRAHGPAKLQTSLFYRQ